MSSTPRCKRTYVSGNLVTEEWEVLSPHLVQSQVTDDEIAGIMASTLVPVMRLRTELLTASTLDESRVRDALLYLGAVGLLTPARVAEIRANLEV